MSDEVSRRAREDELAAELIAKKAARDKADLIKARAWAAETVPVLAEETMRGKYDEGPFVRSYLAGLKAGRAEREE